MTISHVSNADLHKFCRRALTRVLLIEGGFDPAEHRYGSRNCANLYVEELTQRLATMRSAYPTTVDFSGYASDEYYGADLRGHLDALRDARYALDYWNAILPDVI